MKALTFILILLSAGSVLYSQEPDNKILYTGTFTSEGAEGIYMCHFNNQKGELILKKTFKGFENPSFLKVSPDRKFLYAVCRTPSENGPPGGYVSAFRIGENGHLYFINKQPSNGAGPCHVDISPDGNLVAIATYGGGTTSLYPVKSDGSLKPASSTIVNEGAGPNTDRQSKPHAHSIKFSPRGTGVFSADLGTDQLNIFILQGNKLVPGNQKFVKLAPGAGPRHFDFHPEPGHIYVINELNSTVSVLKKKKTRWEVFQTISTIPDDFSGVNYCADIHVADNGRFLYASNRGHNSIAVFEIDNHSKTLRLLETTSTEGKWPRNFTLSPDGRFLLVANQHSGDITVFHVDQKKGTLRFTGNKLPLPAPVCLEFL